MGGGVLQQLCAWLGHVGSHQLILGTTPQKDRARWCLFMERDPGGKGTWTPGIGEMAKASYILPGMKETLCGTEEASLMFEVLLEKKQRLF